MIRWFIGCTTVALQHTALAKRFAVLQCTILYNNLHPFHIEVQSGAFLFSLVDGTRHPSFIAEIESRCCLPFYLQWTTIQLNILPYCLE